MVYVLSDQILEKVKKATWYTVLADNVPDDLNNDPLFWEDLISLFKCNEGIAVSSLGKKIRWFWITDDVYVAFQLHKDEAMGIIAREMSSSIYYKYKKQFKKIEEEVGMEYQKVHQQE